METLENISPSHETPSSISTHDIPEWFLFEILCKLPSKPLFRCKCVSKQFLSLISEPAFIRNYISRASKPRPWTLVSMQTQGDWLQEETFNFERNLDLSLINSYESPTISTLVTPEKLRLIVAMSNGLFLCRWGLVPYHAIFNPVTNQSIVLPESQWLQQSGSIAFHAHVDHVVGVFSYKVLRLLMNWGVPTTDNIIEELSSETNTWTSFTTRFPVPILSSNFLTSFRFKGIFHWYDEVSDDGSGCIISYDPVRIIRSAGSGRIIWCGEIGGTGAEVQTIRCIKLDNGGFIHLWRMKDYDQGTWHLDHTFARSEIFLPSADYNEMVPCRELSNISFHQSEPDLLYFWGQADDEEWMLVSFNVRTRHSRVSNTIPRAHGIFEVQRLFFLDTPFVLPPWPAILLDPSQ